jgi:hypothetical protein
VNKKIPFPSLQIKDSAGLGFGGEGKDGFHDGGMDVDGTVIGWRCCIGIGWGSRETAGKMEASRARLSLAFGEIGGVTVDVEAHVAGVEAKDGVGV